MLISHSPDPEAREKGLKDVKMVMLVTNDSLQCEHAVAWLFETLRVYQPCQNSKSEVPVGWRWMFQLL
jgi:hypothetical protein